MPDINVAYRWAIQKCDADYVRYSMNMNLRDGVYQNGLQYFDCSSFIFWALNAGGFPVVQIFGNNAFNTDSMGAVLLQMGFVQVSRTGQILPGDIGVHHRGSAGGHTEMCYKGGNGAAQWMGAHGSSLPAQQQVSIDDGTLPGTYWDEIYRYGDGAGGEAISLYVIAAMCGNFYGESGVNPGIWEGFVECAWDHQYDGHGGFGLGQWTNVGTPYGRCWNLHEWVTSNGYTDGDGYGQLAFLIHEDYWTPQSIEQSAYASLEDFLTSDSTNIAELTKEYMWHWEGINNSSLATRQQFAQRAYEYITEHYSDNSITTWTSVNAYITETQALNNCVLIARYLSSGYIPEHITGFKIWMAKQHWIRRRRKYW